MPGDNSDERATQPVLSFRDNIERVVMMTKLILRFLMLTLLITAQQAMARRFEASDGLQIVSLSKPQISPDGRMIAIIASRADVARNRSTAELRVVDGRSGKELLALDPTWEVSESRWAPDSRRLAILAKKAGEGGGAQIHVIDMASPEPKAVTRSTERIIQLAWSPDGRRIAYSREEPLDLPRVDGKLVSFEVVRGHYLATEPRKRVQLWTVGADGSGEARITKGPWTLHVPYTGSGPVTIPFAWFPDGKRIVIATQSAPDVDGLDRDLRIVDVATGEVRPLLGGAARAMNPVVSPDGKEVAYWEYPKPGDAFSFSILVVEVATGKIRPSPPQPLDHNLNLALWLPRGDIIVGGNDVDRTALWIQRRSAPPVRIDTGEADLITRYRVAADLAKTGALAFVASTPDSPTELYVKDSIAAAPRRLTDYNRAIRSLELGRVSVLRWRTHDGFEANGIVTMPPGQEPGRRYPLVILPHGGPMQASTLKFNGFTQELAARGWIVFEPNYRGSDNLGRKYQAAIVGDMGEGPGRDIMAGLDALKRQGIVDEDRVAVSGESYGGYMSAWLIGHYPGWRAAVLAAPLLDTADQYDLADVSKTASSRLAGASPWEPGGLAVHQRQSPIYGFASVRTPTLFLSTIGDHRVPVVSSHRMFHALRENGVETRFFAYPVDGHGTSDPARELDWNKRWIDWIAEHFDRPAATGAIK